MPQRKRRQGCAPGTSPMPRGTRAVRHDGAASVPVACVPDQLLHPNRIRGDGLFFRYERSAELSDHSIEIDDLGQHLEALYHASDPEEFVRESGYARVGEGEFEAVGVNAFDSYVPPREMNWFGTSYQGGGADAIYSHLIVFEGESVGENIAGDGLIVVPRKVVARFELRLDDEEAHIDDRKIFRLVDFDGRRFGPR